MIRLLGNLPLVLGLGIMTVFSLDVPILAPLKTETSYGVWVVILVPAAVTLLVLQLVLWIVSPRTRPWGRIRT
jgi:hypothetical protein